jgi:hypothetical protein
VPLTDALHVRIYPLVYFLVVLIENTIAHNIKVNILFQQNIVIKIKV